MSLEGQPFYEFGPFRLEPSERLLLRSGRPVSLPPKAFETLFILVQSCGHVLTKDELMKSLWPETFVEENNLTQQISQLRRTLGDAPEGGSYIETVPRLGYRFVAPVREMPAAQGEEILLRRHTRTRIIVHQQNEEEDFPREEAQTLAPPVSPAATARGRRTPARAWAAASFLAVAALALAGFVAWRSRGLPSRADHPRTLAILPLRNLKPDTESQFLSHSLADAITQRLGYFSELIVRPASYAARYGNADADPRIVARDLDVQSVLTGSYLREGGHLRVSAELVDVAKSEVVWRDTLDLPYDQLWTVQDRVAESVARGLQLHILPSEAERLKKSMPGNPLAYEYYLRAHFDNTPNDYRFSIRMLERSVELDPHYAPAWMLLGNSYSGYAVWQNGGPDFQAKSAAAFDRALALDPELPGVHVFQAVHQMERGELDRGVSSLREELRLHPFDASAHWWLTEAYLYGGMLDASMAEGERAMRLDPLVNTGSSLNTYLHAGEYKKFLATLPAGPSARTSFYRGLCYFYMREFPRAAVEFEEAYRLDPSLMHAKYGRAFLYAIRRQQREGLRYLRELDQETPSTDGEMIYKTAQAYAVLGDQPAALRALQAAVDHSFYCYPCFVRDPLLEPLRGDPAFRRILAVAQERHEDFKRRYF